MRNKSVYIAPFPLNFDGDSLAVVEHEAVEVFVQGMAIDEGPETDPLNDTCDKDFDPYSRVWL